MNQTDFSNIDFDALKNVDIRTVDPDDLIDLNDVKISTDLPKQERIREFVCQIKNPYCYKVGKIVVKVGFSDDGVTLEDRLEHYLRTL